MCIETLQQETACELLKSEFKNYVTGIMFLNHRVAANGVIKVADFGLTEDMYQQKYFRQESNVRLPIKWMALESIHDMVFSEKSDVVCMQVVCRLMPMCYFY